MENRYTYYTPGDDGQQQGQEHYHYEYEQKPKKEKKPVPKWIKIFGIAIACGVVASVAFQATNLVGSKVLGTTANVGKTTKSVDSTTISSHSNSTVDSDIATIAKNSMPSVVSITNLGVEQVQDFFGGIREKEITSAGSGIVIAQTDDELLIVTNNHVVEGYESLTVSFIDEESVEANVKGTDSNKDLAVIAVDLKDVKESTLDAIAVAQLGDSSKLQVGEPTIAIGNALGYGQSVTAGIVSATEREIDGYEGKLIQTDAAINPGNSGGALLNANGEVIGINVAKVSDSTVEGMGYAIPSSDASDIIQELMNQKTKTKVDEDKQGFIGIQGYDVDENSSQMYNLPMGVYVAEVEAGSPAKKAGITKGSIIVKFGGSTVENMEDLQGELQYYEAGEKVEVTISQPAGNGEYEESTVELTLGKKSQ